MSDYVPTDWVDNVTPVDATRMDHIEQGIDLNRDAVIDHETRLDAAEAALPGKEDKSAKGAANGYAPLGADTKVPAVYLPASGAIEYENAWAAGTAYQPGDVVIHNGVEYLAVNPSTGQTPPASPAVAGATVIPLVTALPSSPFDGQEVDLTDSLLTPSWVWRFRYVASAPTNKWKFVGGAPLFHELLASGAQELASGGAYTDPTTPGPLVTIPVAGDYILDFGCWASSSGNYGTSYMSPKFGAATALDADSAQKDDASGSIAINNVLVRQIKRTIAASTVVKMQYRHTTANVQVSKRWLRVTPVAVG